MRPARRDGDLVLRSQPASDAGKPKGGGRDPSKIPMKLHVVLPEDARHVDGASFSGMLRFLHIACNEQVRGLAVKITDVRCYLIEDLHPTYPFRWRQGLPGSGDGTAADRKPIAAILRMDTDVGVTGSLKLSDGEAVASLTRRRLKPLIGEDPLMTERLWTLVWEIDRIEELHMQHLGIVHLLAWDIKSRVAKMPVWKMVGALKAVCRPTPPRSPGTRWTSTSGTSRNASTKASLRSSCMPGVMPARTPNYAGTSAAGPAMRRR